MNGKLAHGLLALSLIAFSSQFTLAAEKCEVFNAPMASVVNFNESAAPGQEVSLKLKTKANIRCDIEVQGAAVTEALALTSKNSDSEGYVSWKWKIPQNYKAQSMPVIVTFHNKDREEKFVTGIAIEGVKGPSLSAVNMPKQAGEGDSIAISVKTVPNAKVKIHVPGAALSEAMALAEQKSDNDGMARWSFHIPKDYDADKLPVVITSENNGQESKLISAIKISRQTAGKTETSQ